MCLTEVEIHYKLFMDFAKSHGIALHIVDYEPRTETYKCRLVKDDKTFSFGYAAVLKERPPLDLCLEVLISESELVDDHPDYGDWVRAFHDDPPMRALTTYLALQDQAKCLRQFLGDELYEELASLEYWGEQR